MKKANGSALSGGLAQEVGGPGGILPDTEIHRSFRYGCTPANSFPL